jgi:O-6-methylguanine DNA methyltransferase
MAQEEFSNYRFNKRNRFSAISMEQVIEIPFGNHQLYGSGQKLGDPKVIRAAAATNGKNNIAIIVPCHRVIGSGRDLVGCRRTMAKEVVIRTRSENCPRRTDTILAFTPALLPQMQMALNQTHRQ